MPAKRYGTPFSRSFFRRSTNSSTERITFPQMMEGVPVSETVSGNVTPLGQVGQPATPSDWLNDNISALRSENAGRKLNELQIGPTEREAAAKNAKGVEAASKEEVMDEKAGGPKTASTVPPLSPAKKRVDYLAGLMALSSLVTAIHFGLTFVSASINPGAYVHYKSEVWARKTVTPYPLNLIWIGPFLMTSSRFLAASYLRNGKLEPIAEKTVEQTPRLIIPIFAIDFFIDAGATKWLMYLPSITWSTWPFTVAYNSFGDFISEIIELMYLIPNAAPQITFNYCTGVLWTIPVQLQGSWLVLLGVIVIREIKTPWKRFGYYIFAS